ncbi:MAG: C4-type zinc ribbon domain-containing protein [Polyangiaceae bacterium]
MRPEIPFLEELSALDTDLKQIEEKLGKHRGEMESLVAEVKAIEARLKADRESLSAMERARGELTGEIRQMSQQIEKSRDKLNRSRNERESNAAQRELEELRKLHRDREEEVERLNTAAEGARTAITEAETKHTELTATIAGTEAGTSGELVTLEAEKVEKLGQREVVAKKIPVVLYRRYESIRTKRPVAIARLVEGTCRGCHLAIPPMMFQRLRQTGELEQCPHCRRIIYCVPPGESAPEPASSTDSQA